MNILFVGDIVGKKGRRIVRQMLPVLQSENDIDFIIANVENAAGGFGITPSIAREILAMEVDVMTSGNHIWDKKEILEYLDNEPRLLRPLNYPPGVPGQGSYVATSAQGIRVGILNLQGRVFMPNIDCPFRCAKEQVSRLKKETSVLVVDFHAEATSEKLAFGWSLDGMVSAVLGTHTHVPTADMRVFPGGTAYVSDVGMTGCYDSVIGVSVETSLPRFLTGMPSRFEVANGSAMLASILLDIDESTGLARSIRRIGPDLPIASVK